MPYKGNVPFPTFFFPFTGKSILIIISAVTITYIYIANTTYITKVHIQRKQSQSAISL